MDARMGEPDTRTIIYTRAFDVINAYRQRHWRAPNRTSMRLAGVSADDATRMLTDYHNWFDGWVKEYRAVRRKLGVSP